MCDTFVAVVPGKKNPSVFFGKNSNREPNEAQILEYYPPQSYSTKKKVHCTYVSIPQVRETNGVLISRPFWMWGAEMGANEKGVAIGCEPVFTKMPYKMAGGLTGMDILRLSLERSDSAEQALATITDLLSDYGQGGITGFQDKKLACHNSFLIADANEVWVLETAGDLWAAVKVKEFYTLGKQLTIGEEFDLSHPDLEQIAAELKLLKPGKTFHFAECFSDKFNSRISSTKECQEDGFNLTSRLMTTGDIQDAFEILRSHGGEPYNPTNHLRPKSVCAHAGNALVRKLGTTGSFIAHLRQEDDSVFWATATAAPCTSVFKPIWLEGNVIPDLGPVPNGQYNSKSYWWYHEKLHRAFLKGYSFLEDYYPERDALQASFVKMAYRLKSKERYTFTCESFSKSRELTKKWWNQLKEKPIKASPNLLFRHYWNKQNKVAELRV